ncbi:MAG: hypothetical protein CM15mP74_29150 [Halieaceae bacterium]|nr:MAG: hypothetical protein CM15mP74_29150 [Halieaceae bacterium]
MGCPFAPPGPMAKAADGGPSKNTARGKNRDISAERISGRSPIGDRAVLKNHPPPPLNDQAIHATASPLSAIPSGHDETP